MAALPDALDLRLLVCFCRDSIHERATCHQPAADGCTGCRLFVLGVAWVVEPAFAPHNVRDAPGHLVWRRHAAGAGCAAGPGPSREISSVGSPLYRAVVRVHFATAAGRRAPRIDAAGKEDFRWRQVCQRIHSRLAELAGRADTVEMARSGGEVRLRRLVAERDQLSEILTGLQDPVVAIDPYGEIVLTNSIRRKAARPAGRQRRSSRP